MKIKFFILTITVSFLMTSCATVFTGTEDPLRFDSDPQGAMVYIDGLKVCKTPCTALVKRNLSDEFAEIKLDGYETRVITLDKKFNAISIINLGFVVGWAVDAATGAIMEYDRKAYNIELEEEKKTSLNNPTRIEIDTKKMLVDIYIAEK